MEKVDRRIKRTQRLLREALIDLTLQKGFNSVTIRDITERADVGYTTFFRHYPDKEALLTDVLDSLGRDFRNLLMPHSLLTAPEKMGTLLFEFVHENANLCRVLLDSTDPMVLLHSVQDFGVEETRQIFAESAENQVPMEIAANHLITALVMLIRWWMDNQMPYSAEQMGVIATKLIICPVIDAFESA